MEREGPGRWIVLAEVAVEVGVEPVATRQDRSEGAVVTRIEGHGYLVTLSRVRIDLEQGITATVIEQPQKHDIASGAVVSGHCTPMIAHRGCHPVMHETVAQIVSRHGQAFSRTTPPSCTRSQSCCHSFEPSSAQVGATAIPSDHPGPEAAL